MDYFQIDFLDVESAKSGDAITVRYEVGGNTFIHVVDGGFQQTGDALVAHINKHYDNPKFIHHVIATHPDGDHLGGLRTILETYNVGTLWMLRPWVYADELLPRFTTYNSIDKLKSRLRSIYHNVAALEEIAERRKIQIKEPFQGAQIGAFVAMSPTKNLYLDLVVESDKTPEAVEAGKETATDKAAKAFFEALKKAVNFVSAAWGAESFSTQQTSSENEMSVVQYALIDDEKILLTGDAGRKALQATIDFAPFAGLTLPGINRFQVPHHGSRRNVSSEILDSLLGPKHLTQLETGTFSAVISSAKADEAHPRKSVVRAMIHRGAKVVSTEGKTICCSSRNAPSRGWTATALLPYPNEQEE